jgi:hypothetical protein
MGYAAGYQAGLDAAKSQGSTPVQGQLTKEQELRQMQKNKSNVNSAYTPPQNYVHPENQHAETPVATETIASPAETPVSTGTVETPKMEVEPAPSSGGFFWMFTSFIFFASIAAVAWYYYQRRFGKRRSRRAPRRWETIRAKVLSHGYSNKRPNIDLEYGLTRHHSIDNQVPLSTYQASAWERVSKGSKFV